jgi:hypothetical protein
MELTLFGPSSQTSSRVKICHTCPDLKIHISLRGYNVSLCEPKQSMGKFSVWIQFAQILDEQSLKCFVQSSRKYEVKCFHDLATQKPLMQLTISNVATWNRNRDFWL